MTRSHRQFDASQLIVASHNQGKVREIMELLMPFGVEAISAGDLNLPEPEETGASFVENAELKALSAAVGGERPALADDSGLCVDGLDGAPGIYSARWGGPQKDFSLAMDKVHRTLEEKGIEDRSAHFTCALCLAWPDGHVESFEGNVHGTLIWPPRGDRGFGYDPIFTPDGFDITFGEMDPADKHGLSHRADAFKQLIHACFKP